METALNEISKALGSLYGLPSYMLVLLTCLVIGYVLRGIKSFDNSGIPLVVVLAGAILNLCMADPRAPPMELRYWIAKNLAIGLIIGFASWRLHKSILKKLEDKIPFLRGLIVDEETKFLTRRDALIADREAEVEKQKAEIGVVKP